MTSHQPAESALGTVSGERRQHGPEMQKFLAWYERQQRDHGLLDIQFMPGRGSDADGNAPYPERFCRAANRVVELIEAGRFTHRRHV